MAIDMPKPRKRDLKRRELPQAGLKAVILASAEAITFGHWVLCGQEPVLCIHRFDARTELMQFECRMDR